jgi:hypothetical protein
MIKYFKRIILVFLLPATCTCFAQSKHVLLDSYFNDEHMKDAAGKMISYHYKWE